MNQTERYGEDRQPPAVAALSFAVKGSLITAMPASCANPFIERTATALEKA